MEHPPAASRRATLVGPRTAGQQRSAKVAKGRQRSAKVGKGRERSGSVPLLPHPWLRHDLGSATLLLHSSLPMPPNASQWLPMAPNASQCRPAVRPHCVARRFGRAGVPCGTFTFVKCFAYICNGCLCNYLQVEMPPLTFVNGCASRHLCPEGCSLFVPRP